MKKVWLTTIAAIVFAVISTVGCKPKSSNSSSQDSTPVLQVGVGSWIGYAPLFYAQQAGLDRKNGFKLDLVRITDNQVRRDALLAGKLDANVTTIDMAAITATINPKLRLFFATDVSTGGDGLIAKTNLQSIADLKGKKIAVEEGTPSHFLLLYALNKAGLSLNDVKIIPARTETTPELLKLGSVDAVVTWQPWLARAEQFGFHVLFSTKEHDDLILDVFETLDSTMQKKRGLLEALCRTWEDALKSASTANGITVMANAYNVDGNMTAKKFESMLQDMRWLNIRENKSWFAEPSPSRAEGLLKEAHERYQSAGKLTSSPIPVLEIVDESIVRALKAEQSPQ